MQALAVLGAGGGAGQAHLFRHCAQEGTMVASGSSPMLAILNVMRTESAFATVDR